jgi:hypothetical protein
VKAAGLRRLGNTPAVGRLRRRALALVQSSPPLAHAVGTAAATTRAWLLLGPRRCSAGTVVVLAVGLDPDQATATTLDVERLRQLTGGALRPVVLADVPEPAAVRAPGLPHELLIAEENWPHDPTLHPWSEYVARRAANAARTYGATHVLVVPPGGLADVPLPQLLLAAGLPGTVPDVRPGPASPPPRRAARSGSPRTPGPT